MRGGGGRGPKAEKHKYQVNGSLAINNFRQTL